MTEPSKPFHSPVPFRDAFYVWLRIAALSFGGPAGQIAVMHRILVEEKKWIGEERFLFALNYCMLLPGPEAHQLAVYIGWLMHRVWGGIVAGLLFILPGLLALGILSWVYVAYGDVPLVDGLFFGVKAAVLAIVIDAVLRIGRRALKTRMHVAIAALAFLALFLFAVPFPLVIAAAALIGALVSFVRPGLFTMTEHKSGHGPSEGAIDRAFATDVPDHIRPSAARLVKTLVIGSLVWLGPLVALGLTLGWHNVFTEIAAFNSKMAVVTFGGAYAVLAYMAQQAVELYGWLMPDEMLIGLGFAETTPGPLISVVQFVGFMGAYRMPGALDPVLAGTLGGVLAMWSTFVPSFLWIFLGGPYVETLQRRAWLAAALSSITAAVVGVILNLSLWFALHFLFTKSFTVALPGHALDLPDPASLDLSAALLSLAAAAGLFLFRLGVVPTILFAAVAGACLRLL